MKGGAIVPYEAVEKEEPVRKNALADSNVSWRLYVPIGPRAV